MVRKIYVHDISDYVREPDVYQKNAHNPFGWGSLTWLIYFFKLITRRKRVRVFQSYGRTEDEARRGLERAMHKRGFITITHGTYLKYRGKRDDE